VADRTLGDLGLEVTFGRHALERDEYSSSSIESRVADLHDAFSDPSVQGVLTTIGGHNANQLLPHIDFDLLRRNPKVFCGYSDVTVLLNAIVERCGWTTYYGPHYSTFGVERGNQPTVDAFRAATQADGPFAPLVSKEWSDDEWYIDQERREFHPNPGPRTLREGRAEGTLIGGNLDTLNLIQGTPYFPSVPDPILLIEEDDMAGPDFAIEFFRNMHSLLQQTELKGLRGILIARCPAKVQLTSDDLHYLLRSLSLPSGIPVIANVDTGHTLPMGTFPLGAKVTIDTEGSPDQILLGLGD
jgi:muramoyltetrapeptide carboxypeptidase LdcA involved in peptidoglycan recycling